MSASIRMTKPPAAPTATRAGDAAPAMCAYCWGSRAILQGGVLGLVPVVCRRCSGTGREPAGLSCASLPGRAR